MIYSASSLSTSLAYLWTLAAPILWLSNASGFPDGRRTTLKSFEDDLREEKVRREFDPGALVQASLPVSTERKRVAESFIGIE
jgi:hypothetical protein